AAFQGRELGTLRARDVRREGIVEFLIPPPRRRQRTCAPEWGGWISVSVANAEPGGGNTKNTMQIKRPPPASLRSARSPHSLRSWGEGKKQRGTRMKITDVRAHHIRIPYDAGPASFRQGASAISALDMVVIEVATDAGLTGWGDAFAYVCPRTTCT